jgi:predicted lipoprotein with Yx(FWY)xxD motif
MRNRIKTWGPLVLPVAALALAACGSTASAGSGTPTATAAATKDVKTASTSLGTVLANSRSHTLYHLTVEKKGHFICTGACTQLWHPLHPRKGHSPTGVSHLGVVTRPDHTKQITYKGFPLYTFAQDTKKGDVKGQGFKDVGTWTVIKVHSASTTMPAPTSTGTSTGGGSGGYGY